VATEFLSNEAGRPCLNGTMSFAFYRTSKPAFRILHHPEQTQDPIPNTHRFIAMLGKRTGATIAAIVTATEWQQHSVRGFLAGVVRKTLGLNLISEHRQGRVYRIKDGKVVSATADRTQQAG
jgi:hypothetical protein